MMMSLPSERTSRDLDDEELLGIGKEVLDMEAAEISRASARLGNELVQAARLIQSCKGRLVVVGMGKSGIIGRKIAATLASLGTPAFFLHAAEGAHGDLGMVCREDVGLFISHSGKTREVLELLPFFSRLGAPIVAISGDSKSPLAAEADIYLNSGIEKEADPLNLAPTSSTSVQLAIGDALAGMVTELKNLQKEDFALFHPAGSLGKTLLTRVSDLMGKDDNMPVVGENASVSEALFEITSKGYGATTVVDCKNGNLAGIFTDGDLRRLMERKGCSCLEERIGDVMIKTPMVISPNKLAAEAMHVMEQHEVSVLVAVEDGKPVGMIHIHEILKAGVA